MHGGSPEARRPAAGAPAAAAAFGAAPDLEEPSLSELLEPSEPLGPPGAPPQSEGLPEPAGPPLSAEAAARSVAAAVGTKRKDDHKRSVTEVISEPDPEPEP